MERKKTHLLLAVILFVTVVSMMTSFGQVTANASPGAAASATATVPRLVQYSGTANDINGKPLTGTLGITFMIYRDKQGGAPLWIETQNVQADAKGHYSVQLGATKSDGLPTDMFNSGEARWLGVQIADQGEQPRVLLMAVPYALKAADASTIGGLPPSAFVRTNSEAASSAGNNSTGASNAEKASGTVQQNQAQPETLLTVKTNSPGNTIGFLPIWTGSKSPTTQVGSSNLFQSGNNLGLGTTSPAALLDVNGTSDFRDTLTLFPKGSDSVLSVVTAQGTPFSITNAGDVVGHFGFFQGLTTLSNGVLVVNNQTATSGIGLLANSLGTSGVGMEGAAGASSGKTTGVFGFVNSPNGTGVYALAQGASQTGSGVGCCPVGVWGDTVSKKPGAAGLVGTADDARAIYLENNSPSGVPTAFIQQDANGQLALVAGGTSNKCTIDTNGHLFCPHVGVMAPVDGNQRQVALYGVQSPQNWFEDFGSGQLAAGAARVGLEPTFAQTVNTGSEYHVFLTPEGDCRGLYVSNKSASGFEVHELGGGQSNVAFSYRIVALRRGYENARLEDKTEMVAKSKANILKPSATQGQRWTPPVPPKPQVMLPPLHQDSNVSLTPAKHATAGTTR